MKVCSACGETKSLDVFKWKNKATGIRQTQCDPCRKATAKKSYGVNRAKIITDSMRRTQELRDWFVEYKKQFKCKFCTEDCYACLDFHHLNPAEKDLDVSSMVARRSRPALLKELAKCICVCSNCHRKIHAGLIVV